MRGNQRASQHGAALVMAMAFIVTAALMSAAMVRTVTLHMRGAYAELESVRAFQAADAALAFCESRLLEHLQRTTTGEGRVLQGSVELGDWPDTVRSPRCMTTRLNTMRGRSSAYRIDAVAYGGDGQPRAWSRLDVWKSMGAIHTRWSLPALPPGAALAERGQRRRPPRRRSLPRRLLRQRQVRRSPLLQRLPQQRLLQPRLPQQQFSQQGSIQQWPHRRRLLRPRSSRFPHKTGFTLIEAMCAVAMAAVLASYAVPVYIAHTAHAHRLAAMLALGRAAQYLEARRVIAGATNAAVSQRDATQQGEAENDSLPNALAQVPAGAAKPVYRLSVSTLSLDDYRIDAVPTLEGPMRHDPCGVLSVDASGRFLSSGPLGTDACLNRR